MAEFAPACSRNLVIHAAREAFASTSLVLLSKLGYGLFDPDQWAARELSLIHI